MGTTKFGHQILTPIASMNSRQGYIVNQNWQYQTTKIDNTQPII
jgi:hypothetical protein